MKLITLTEKGKKAAKHIDTVANKQVISALEKLDSNETEQVIKGLYLYSKALKQARTQSKYTIQRLKKSDAPKIISITKKVWAEFGFDSNHPNAKIYEKELNDMMKNYLTDKAHYYVVIFDGIVVGGGGFSSIPSKKTKTCELKNMYFLPDARGLGLGSALLKHILAKIKEMGYKKIYIETMDFMHRANTLYLKNGFKPQKKPMFNTGHVWTNCWYLKNA